MNELRRCIAFERAAGAGVVLLIRGGASERDLHEAGERLIRARAATDEAVKTVTGQGRMRAEVRRRRGSE